MKVGALDVLLLVEVDSGLGRIVRADSGFRWARVAKDGGSPVE